VSSALALYSQTPDCDFDFTYEAKLFETSSNSLVDLPPFFTFNASTQTFSLSKCFGVDAALTDNSCNFAQQELEYTLVIVATTVSTGVYTNSQASFKVTVQPDCDLDQLSYPPGTVTNSYVLATPATPLDLYTAPTTTVPNCALACSISPANDPVVSSFDPTTGAFTVLTGDKSLDGTTK